MKKQAAKAEADTEFDKVMRGLVEVSKDEVLEAERLHKQRMKKLRDKKLQSK